MNSTCDSAPVGDDMSADAIGHAAEVYEPGELLRVVGALLGARGLEVRGLGDGGGMPTHAEVTSPGHPDRGVVSIGWDGYLIWERWGPVSGGAVPGPIVDIVAGVLNGEWGDAAGREVRPGD